MCVFIQISGRFIVSVSVIPDIDLLKIGRHNELAACQSDRLFAEQYIVSEQPFLVLIALNCGDGIPREFPIITSRPLVSFTSSLAQ